MEETTKILNERKFKKLTSNMEIIERDGFFDGYAIYTFLEAKKDNNKTLWFVKLQAPNKKPKYLMVPEQQIKWLLELRQKDKEFLSMMLSDFLFR
jgi:hypothetical protein